MKQLAKPITKATWDIKHINGGIALTIPENMPSLNRWKNWHWGQQSRYKKALTQSLKLLAAKAGNPSYSQATLQIFHYHRVNRRRDEDNLAPKFLLDALVQSGILADDNLAALTQLPPVFEIDKLAWRTEVHIHKGLMGSGGHDRLLSPGET